MSRAFAGSVVALAVLLATAAGADDRGFYASIKFGSTDVEQSLGSTFDQFIDGEEDSRAYELGFRFGRFLGVQGGFHDFGKFPGIGVPCRQGDAACPEAGEVLVPVQSDTKAYSAAVVPRLPLPFGLSAFAKVGMVFWESDVESIGFGSLGSFSTLKKLKTGHYHLSMKVNNKQGDFILDTGASTSCIGFESIVYFILESEESEIKAAGAGAIDMETKIAKGNQLDIGGLHFSHIDLILFDLSHVNSALEQVDEKRVHGILGADLLKRMRAVIDYGRNCVYIK